MVGAWLGLDVDPSALAENGFEEGCGTALLTAVCGAAHAAGGTHGVLNATPAGKLLYQTCGFAPIGEGVTWWRQLSDPRSGS